MLRRNLTHHATSTTTSGATEFGNSTAPRHAVSSSTSTVHFAGDAPSASPLPLDPNCSHPPAASGQTPPLLHGIEKFKAEVLKYTCNNPPTLAIRHHELHPMMQRFVNDFTDACHNTMLVQEKLEFWEKVLAAVVDEQVSGLKREISELEQKLESLKKHHKERAATKIAKIEGELKEKRMQKERQDVSIVHFIRELKALQLINGIPTATKEACRKALASILLERCQSGYGIEMVNGDTLAVDADVYKDMGFGIEDFGNDCRPISVAVVGPQSSGKSTLMDMAFGVKFPTSSTRCTRGINVAVANVEDPETREIRPTMLLDTEGLFSLERSDPHFDKKVTNFLLSTCSTVILNVKGQLLDDIKQYLKIFAFCVEELKLTTLKPNLIIVMRDMKDTSDYARELQLETIRNNLLNEPIPVEKTDDLGSHVITVADFVTWNDENLVLLPSAFKDPESSFEWMDTNAEPRARFQRTHISQLFITECAKLTRLICKMQPHRRYTETIKTVPDFFAKAQEHMEWNKKYEEFMSSSTIKELNENTIMNRVMLHMRSKVTAGSIQQLVLSIRRAFAKAAKSNSHKVDLKECKLEGMLSINFSPSCQTLRDRFEEVLKHSLRVPDDVKDNVALDESLSEHYSAAFRLTRLELAGAFKANDVDTKVTNTRLLKEAKEGCYQKLRDLETMLRQTVGRDITAMEIRGKIEQQTQDAKMELLGKLRNSCDSDEFDSGEFSAKVEEVLSDFLETSQCWDDFCGNFLDATFADSKDLKEYKRLLLNENHGTMSDLVEGIRAWQEQERQHAGGGGGCSNAGCGPHRPSLDEDDEMHLDRLVALVNKLLGNETPTNAEAFKAYDLFSMLAAALASPALDGTMYTSVLKKITDDVTAASKQQATNDHRILHLSLRQLCESAVLFVHVKAKHQAEAADQEQNNHAICQLAEQHVEEFHRLCDLIRNFDEAKIVQEIKAIIVDFFATLRSDELNTALTVDVPEETITKLVTHLLNDLLLNDLYDGFFAFLQDPNGEIERYYLQKWAMPRVESVVKKQRIALHFNVCNAFKALAEVVRSVNWNQHTTSVEDSIQALRRALSTTSGWENAIFKLLEETCTDEVQVARVVETFSGDIIDNVSIDFEVPDSLSSDLTCYEGTMKRHFLENVRGSCRSHCPYCRTICTADHVTRPGAKCESVLHLFRGMGAWRCDKTKVLSIVRCSYQSDRELMHEGKSYTLDRHIEKVHPNWVIKRFTSEFDINEADEFEKALVRAFIKLNDRLAKAYNAKPAVFPESWLEYGRLFHAARTQNITGLRPSLLREPVEEEESDYSFSESDGE